MPSLLSHALRIAEKENKTKQGKERQRQAHTERKEGAFLESKQIESQEMHLKSLVFKGQGDRGSV